MFFAFWRSFMALETRVQRQWHRVEGVGGKANDLLHGVCQLNSTDSNVLFFPGDVQETEENMKKGPNGEWVRWSYEATVDRLCERFPHSNVFLVRPARTVKETFSCFDHFVNGNLIGAPDHADSFGATHQATELIQKLRKEIPLLSRDWTLVGFSHGCVVLNQICYEMAALEQAKLRTSRKEGACERDCEYPDDDVDVLDRITTLAADWLEKHDIAPIQDFLSDIKVMYWLDGGHSGMKHTWITDDATLRAMANIPDIQVHVTPYQMKDKARPWLALEERQFVDKLKQYGANITEKLHFKGKDKSLDIHFSVLQQF
jgi:hypothetical protein